MSDSTADRRTPGVRSVAVCGSCITRDNFNSRFNPEHRRWYSVDAHANQSSMIAMMSPPVTAEVSEADGLGDYDTWNVRSDLERMFLTDVVEAQPNFLLLDFFGDVHFGVLRLDDGRHVTDNRWKLRKTAQYAAWQASGTTTRVTLRNDPETYFPLWVEAMDRFAAYIAEHCPRTRVIVHRGFNASEYVTGPTDRPRPLSGSEFVRPMRVDRVNELWARLDEHAITAYGWESIDLRAECYTTFTEHPWGPYWVHYTLDYYPRFLAELHQFDLQDRLPAQALEKLQALADAGRERNQRQAAFVRRAVAEQDQEVVRIQGRGPVTAARSAWRARRRKEAAR